MSKNWTQEQQAAIEAPGQVLVSAAAGSGKTAVLTQRILQLLLREQDPLNIDDLLVVTFTRAAAMEMRERLRAALERALVDAAEEVRAQRLLEQVALLPQADITTLHSFCLRLLRSYAYLVGWKPDFRMGDERELRLLQSEALEKTAEEYYRQRPAEMAFLVDYFSSRYDDEAFLEQILVLYEYARNEPDPVAWLEGLKRPYEALTPEEVLAGPWGQAGLRHVRRQLDSGLAYTRRALYLAALPWGPGAYTAALQGDAVLWEGLIRTLKPENWDDFQASLSQAAPQRLTPLRQPKTADAKELAEWQCRKEEAQELRKKAKKILKECREELLVWPLAEQIAYWPQGRRLTSLLAEWTKDFDANYRQAKKERNMMDFSDLEHLSLELLAREDFAGLKRMYRQVLVDEYQDINGVQERILAGVAAEAGEDSADLFLVGDVKQSIYRFRKADPGLFLHKYRTWERVLHLRTNFRSRRSIVEGVNSLFAKIMSEQTGEISYNEDAALRYGAPFPDTPASVPTGEGPLECHLLDLTAMNPTSCEGEAVSSIQAEAEFAAKRILEMVCPEDGETPLHVFDKDRGVYRPVSFGDIALLMRTAARQMEIYKEVFASWGIPHYGEYDTNYFKATEVEMVIALLRILDNPRQDIPLAAVLRAPFVACSGEELGKIRSMSLEGDFWEALHKALEIWTEKGRETDLRGKLADFLAKYERWRKWLNQYSLDEIIWRLYEETSLLEQAGAMPGGTSRQENLEDFYNRAKRFSETQMKGLYSFLQFLDRCQDEGQGIGRKHAPAEGGDFVRLLTVHGSKGLEYPVVFVVGIGRRFNRRSFSGKLLLHKDLGAGLRIMDQEHRLFFPSFIHNAVKYQLEAEFLAEEMRILYVALTRAREKLLLWGSRRDLDSLRQALPLLEGESQESFTGLVGEANSYLEWILLAVSENDPAWRFQLYDSPREWQAMKARKERLAKAAQEMKTEAKDRQEIPVGEPDQGDWPVKTSVTQLKKLLEQDFLLERPLQGHFAKPSFAKESPVLTPAEKGVATHLYLQHAPWETWRELWTSADRKQRYALLESWRDEAVQRFYLTPQQGTCIDLRELLYSLQGDLGDYLFKSRNLRREAPFVLQIEKEGEVLLIQGVVDVLGESREGRLFLLDYKTDFLAGWDWERELIRRYALQLAAYGQAVGRLTGRSVEEHVIYSLSRQKKVIVPKERLAAEWESFAGLRVGEIIEI